MAYNLDNQIKSLRSELGLSQVQLSQETGVSLPTIQNIEAGKANPSLATLEALYDALGAKLASHVESPDWQMFIACGLPLMPLELSKIRPSAKGLVRELRRAVLQRLSEREREAVSALLWALRDHYPMFFARNFRGSAFETVLRGELSGRLLSLRRNALARLGDYL